MQNTTLANIVAKLDATKNDIKNMSQNIRIDHGSSTNNQSFAGVVKNGVKPAVIIKPKDDRQNCSETFDEIKNNVDYRQINACGIRNIRGGGIVISCDTPSTTLQLKSIVDSKLKDKYDVKLPEIKRPRLRIKFIYKEIPEAELVEVLKTQNDILKDKTIVIIKILKPKDTNKKHYDVVFETDCETSESLLRMRFINLGWKRCEIVKHTHITRCFKCNGFSHISTNCTGRLSCGRCAGSHKTSECNSTRYECVNCKLVCSKYSLKLDYNHHAWSSDCITLQRKLQKFSNNLQYNE